MEVKSSRNTSHTINSGMGSKCFRTNTPMKGKKAEYTEEIGVGGNSLKYYPWTQSEANEEFTDLDVRRAAERSGKDFRPVVTFDHDYDAKHQGRLMYSGDTKVSTTHMRTNITKNITDKSHRFHRVCPSGKSYIVSPVQEDDKSGDESSSWFWSYKSKGNNNVSSNSQIAPIQIDMKEELSTGGVKSNIGSDQHRPLRAG